MIIAGDFNMEPSKLIRSNGEEIETKMTHESQTIAKERGLRAFSKLRNASLRDRHRGQCLFLQQRILRWDESRVYVCSIL